MLYPKQQRTSGNEFPQLSLVWSCDGIVVQEWLLVAKGFADTRPKVLHLLCVSLFSEMLCGTLVSQGTLAAWNGSSASSVKPPDLLHAFKTGSALCHGGGLLATQFSCRQLGDAPCEIPLPSEGWTYPGLCQTQCLPHIHCLFQPWC